MSSNGLTLTVKALHQVRLGLVVNDGKHFLSAFRDRAICNNKTLMGCTNTSQLRLIRTFDGTAGQNRLTRKGQQTTHKKTVKRPITKPLQRSLETLETGRVGTAEKFWKGLSHQ